ncbi:class I SAM-dependent methyltransferase [Haloprofundus sp. MHR1]|uniref:class I SAM-dependent methyltransferase n=1 Tax=Haloprofundus sp. MHR1 TaxID=2572921 RepID=UPI0010BE677A|nr:class I SAM-dependent methyltransferase [Haloprofundus sp. MHR1]QCJ46485.1 class I SAM-dependent methyltransferase [Haloprofundus sp. MHR1]
MTPDELRQRWAERSGEFSPDYYAHYGPDETSEAIRRHIERTVDSESEPSILELGCSSGRHLAHLHDNGYRNLHGIDVNEEAMTVMRQAYPELAAAGTFYIDAIESVVSAFDDDAFDVVYSVETLQHIHPDNEWVFDELARVAADCLLTVEIEGDADAETPEVNYVDDAVPLYHRRWSRIFSARGFTETASERLDNDTLRLFRRSADVR